MVEGDKSLAGSKYLWLYAQENLPKRHRGRFASLRDTDLKTARAWASRRACATSGSTSAEDGPSATGGAGTSGPPTPVSSRSSPARTLKRHEAGLLSYFAHPITNAGAEGLNSRIQAIRVSARGYRNREHFKTAIHFHLGGLALYPQTH